MSKFHLHLKKLADLCSRHKFFVEHTMETTQGTRSVFDYGHLGSEMRRNLKNIWWHDVVTSKETVNGVELSMFDVNEQLPLNDIPALNHRVIELENLTKKLFSLYENKLQIKTSMNNALQDIISTNSTPIRRANKNNANVLWEHIIGSQPSMPAGYAWHTKGVSIATDESDILR